MSSTRRSPSTFTRPVLPPSTTSAPPALANPLSTTSSSSSCSFPTTVSSSESASITHRPFKFGVEFEFLLRPKAIAELDSDLTLPESDASVREQRNFNLAVLKAISNLLLNSGLLCDVYDQNSDDKRDYSHWNVTLDGWVSKKHILDGFYPVEVISPIIIANKKWRSTVDKFWSVMQSHFTFRRDASCGFHLHGSPVAEK
ncbi:hypothetical protein HBI56_149990 [Parastagonospora nodorum]|nr:hypothetical protein HBH53_151250 [Parastagonospora nodorum]KAH3964990.1 hypothetical protein HBH51_156140 [Parastagonospora nodorum]KAH3995481.1 hypothetical protein HBI10_174240 [Parastagonospora nodorum]KAH4016041.1 hypothetical protein HBI13_152510 [Parastagonospora nodorum]KAH4017422.1 hypothetical protein HBI09_197110 [Parastagonospora nodorum]